jgi:Ribbon-helix-helix domain
MPMERLQILLRAEQAAYLREVSRVQGVPVTELVREAIDQAFPHPRVPQRRAGWARFNALPVVPGGPAPEALEELLDNRVDKLLPPG